MVKDMTHTCSYNGILTGTYTHTLLKGVIQMTLSYLAKYSVTWSICDIWVCDANWHKLSTRQEQETIRRSEAMVA